ncbi:MAG: hypothetical protein R3314_10765 [Longimicrobiales bacterium]|nr:hypothetical protein [Longimicrobiales bacterium]
MRRAYTSLAVALLLAAGAGGTAAQSVTSLTGLGYPMVATDARSEALGGLGVGLIGLAVPFTNPASAAGVSRRGVVVSAASTERSSTLGDVSASTGTTRFPLMRMLFPVGDLVLSAGYGTYLDQSWGVTRTGSEMLSTGSIGYRDVLTSTGGIGQAQLGAALPLGRTIAVGLSLTRYTGRQDVAIRRQFDDTTSIGSLQPYSETRAFQYGGVGAQVGVRWDPSPAARLAASVTWSGTLNADSVAGQVSSQEYELPLQVAGGASVYLSTGIMAAFSGRWSGWSVTDPSGGLIEPETTVVSRDTWEIGGGIEFDDPDRRQVRSFPLRLGFQYRQLPFTFVSDQPTEWLASAGLGMRIGADFNTPVARIDLTIQRGARTAAGGAGIDPLDETLWRFALGVSIFGT